MCCTFLFELLKSIMQGDGDFFGSKKSIVIKIFLFILAIPLSIILLPIAFVLDIILLPFWLFIWERHKK